jgi:hypothetical protein
VGPPGLPDFIGINFSPYDLYKKKGDTFKASPYFLWAHLGSNPENLKSYGFLDLRGCTKKYKIRDFCFFGTRVNKL